MNRKLSHHSIARATVSGLFLAVLLLFANTVAAQVQPTQMATKASTADAQMKQMCGSREVVSTKRGNKTTYSCKSQSKPKRAGTSTSSSASTSLKAADDGGLRAEINCSYNESGGTTTWLGCTCKANDDGNCNQFITNCAEQGDEVGGNSGSASCGPSGG